MQSHWRSSGTRASRLTRSRCAWRVKFWSICAHLSVKTGIVTNGTVRLQQARIDALELHVDAVVISEQIGVKKPAPEPFLECLRRLEVVASEAWFVSDHAVNDIAGAHHVGMRAFWLEIEQHTEPEGIEFTRIEALSDLELYLSSKSI